MCTPEANVIGYFEEELLADLIAVDSMKLCGELQKHQLLSKEVKNFFESLDHDNTEADTRVRFLLKLVTDKVVTNECCFKNLLNVLVKVDCRDLCDKLRDNLQKWEIVSDSNAEAGSEIGKKRGRVDVGCKILNKNDVAILTEVLTDCCHKWEEIGVCLQLKQHEIKQCGEASSNMLKLANILRTWLERTTFDTVPPTLDGLKTVISSGFVSRPDIACELVEKFTDKMSKYTFYKSKKPCRPVPLSITYQSTDLEIANGKSALLEVKAESSENMQYQWNKDGQKISNDIHYSHVDGPFLLIKSVKLEMEGNYSCTIISSNNERIESDPIRLSVTFPLITQYFFDIYSKYDELPKDPWPPVTSTSFVNLALITKNKIKNDISDYTVQGDIDDILENKEKIEYEELFGNYDSGTILLVEGRPGSGKTTLMHKVTRDWSLKKDVLVGAKLVILIPLRLFSSFNNNLNLSDIIKYYVSSADMIQEILSHIENSRGHGVCFIIDGLDEYKQRDIKSNTIYKLMYKILFPLSMVIVASRPVGSAKFRNKCQSQINKRIEVLGFSKQEIFAYINQYNFDDMQRASSLEEYLKCHDKVLHMCYLPVHAAMICYLYNKLGENIPQTETKVYECFTLLSIKRKLMSDDEVSYANFSSIIQLTGDVKTCFYSICELAFQMTKASKQAIHQNETAVLLSTTRSNSTSLGLVTIDSAAKLFSYEDFYTYLHLTFQEYLASVHLTTLANDDLVKTINSCKNKPEFLMVWRFLCGSIDFSEKEFVLDELLSSENMDTMNKLLCGFESQQQKVCNYILQSGSLSFKDQTFTTSDFVAFNYVITNSKKFLNRLEFVECRMQEEGVKLFLENLTPEHFSQLIYLGYHKKRKKCTVSNFKMLNMFLQKCFSLERLNLEKTELSRSGLNELTRGVNLPSLDFLKLQIPLNVSLLDIKLLSQLKFKSNSLSKVEFNCGKHKINETEELSNSYQMLYNVFEDSVYWNPECPMINSIPGHIQLSDFSNCSKLILVNCGLIDDHMNMLVNCLVTYKKLKELKLDFNQISGVGANILASSFEKCAKLEVFSAHCNQIDDSGALALANEFIHLNSFARVLDLQYNMTSEEGVRAVTEATENLSNCHLFITVNRMGFAASKKNNINSEVLQESIKTIWKGNSRDKVNALKCLRFVPEIHINGKTNSCMNFKWTYDDISLLGCLQFSLNIYSLKFCNNQMSLADTRVLASALKSCTSIHTLNLARNDFGLSGAKALSAALKSCTSIHTLDLAGNKIGSFGAEALAAALKSCSTIHFLDLAGNGIGSSGAKALAAALKSCSSIHTLDLADNGIGSFGAEALSAALKSWTSIHTLNLADNEVSSSGAEALGAALKSCTSIHTLNLAGNGIGSSGAESLSAALKSCTSINTLDLAGNGIGSSGAEALGAALKSCTRIHTLNLAYSRIGSSGAEALGAALKSCTSIHTLDLAGNGIGLSGAEALGAALKSCTSIHSLDLSGNGIGSSGAEALSAALKSCTSIHTLDLAGNDIGSSGAEALNAALKSGTS